MIAKLSQGSLVLCPKSGVTNQRYHSNLSRYYETHLDIAALDGYYPVEYTEKPDGDYIPSWEMDNNVIRQVWTPYTPIAEPDDPISARLDMIEECILEMSEVIYA